MTQLPLGQPGRDREELLETAVEYLRLLVESTNEGIVGVDRKGRCTFANAAALRLLGCDAGRLVGELFLEVVSEDDGILRRSDGSSLPTGYTTKPIVVDGDVQGAVVVFPDVRAEVEAERLKDEFMSLVSHELRTPLSSVLGYLELLEREDVGPLTPDQRHCVAAIGRNANRLLRLVGDLLLVAQLEAGDVPLEPEPVSLAALGAEALESARPRATRKGIDLRLEVAGEPVVHADRERLGHVLDNLLSNAVKFTDAHGRVSVRVAVEPRGAVIEVADTGVGIPAAECEQLFTPFFRTESARVLAVQGSGLGLAISKALVVAHGGCISCRSAEGVGTTFRVELPASRRGTVLALAGVRPDGDGPGG